MIIADVPAAVIMWSYKNNIWQYRSLFQLGQSIFLIFHSQNQGMKCPGNRTLKSVLASLSLHFKTLSTDQYLIRTVSSTRGLCVQFALCQTYLYHPHAQLKSTCIPRFPLTKGCTKKTSIFFVVGSVSLRCGFLFWVSSQRHLKRKSIQLWAIDFELLKAIHYRF